MTALTELTFVPLWAVQVARLVLWLAMAHLLFRYAQSVPQAIHRREMPTWGIYGNLALVVFVLRSAVVQLERWQEPLALEGLPMTALAVAFALTARRARARSST